MEEKIGILSSPVPKLIGTNDTPSATEIALINATMSMAQHRLFDLQENISKTQSVMDGLLREQESVWLCYNEHKVLLSPIRRLPAEVLSIVFMFCLPADWTMINCSPQDTPMLLSQICGHWRAVAVSTPGLWSSINLESWPDNPTSKLPLLKVWLKRSGESALSIRLRNEQPSVIQFFLPHSCRLRHFDIMCPTSMLNQLAPLQGLLKSLETLEIDTMDDSNHNHILLIVGATWNHTLHAFQVAPRLHSVSIGCGVPPHMLYLPWAGLTECTAHYCSVEECLHILSQSPNLVTCRMDCGRPRGRSRSGLHIPTDIIQLHKLLSFYVNAWAYPGDLFGGISLPAIRNLHVEHTDLEFPWPHTAFYSSISGSSQSLHSLVLDSVPITDAYLIQYLEAAPLLRRLDIRDCASCISSELVRRLTFHSVNHGCGGPVLASKLQELTLFGVFTVGGMGISDMIESRWRQRDGVDERLVACLEVVRLVPQDRDDDLDDVAIKRLTALREDGLDISVAFDSERIV